MPSHMRQILFASHTCGISATRLDLHPSQELDWKAVKEFLDLHQFSDVPWQSLRLKFFFLGGGLVPCENPKFFCWWRSNIKASRQQINKTTLLYWSSWRSHQLLTTRPRGLPPLWVNTSNRLRIDHFGLESMLSQTAMRTPV